MLRIKLCDHLQGGDEYFGVSWIENELHNGAHYPLSIELQLETNKNYFY